MSELKGREGTWEHVSHDLEDSRRSFFWGVRKNGPVTLTEYPEMGRNGRRVIPDTARTRSLARTATQAEQALDREEFAFGVSLAQDPHKLRRLSDVDLKRIPLRLRTLELRAESSPAEVEILRAAFARERALRRAIALVEEVRHSSTHLNRDESWSYFAGMRRRLMQKMRRAQPPLKHEEIGLTAKEFAGLRTLRGKEFISEIPVTEEEEDSGNHGL